MIVNPSIAKRSLRHSEVTPLAIVPIGFRLTTATGGDHGKGSADARADPRGEQGPIRACPVTVGGRLSVERRPRKVRGTSQLIEFIGDLSAHVLHILELIF